MIAKQIPAANKDEEMKWECTSECKPLTEAEVHAIVTLKQAFMQEMPVVRQALDACDDGCPNYHSINRLGHPLVCSNNGGCKSQLRILRAASTHFPVLRKFLHEVHIAIKNHMNVFEIDKALCAGDYRMLMVITKMYEFTPITGLSLWNCVLLWELPSRD